MECNRDEAARAKEIAEKKFYAKDIAGAKKFAVKAQNLYPDLEGISHMIATLDVYIWSENKISGESDWYGILGVNPTADDEIVRKQYRKLALMLHPDKNKSMGADGAFNLISEAWRLLSDKAKRLAYDQKRNSNVLHHKVQPPSGGSSAPAGPNDIYNFNTKSTTSHTKPPKGNNNNATRTGPTSVPPSSHRQKPASVPSSSHKQKQTTFSVSHKQKPANAPVSSQKPKADTFWTVCTQCKMHYEYLRMYLNRNLLCPTCNQPFFSLEIHPPSSKGSKPFTKSKQNTNHQRTSKNMPNPGRNSSAGPNVGPTNGANFQWGPFSKTTGSASTAQAASMVQQAYEKVKRERQEAQAAIKREEALRRKYHASKRTGPVSSHGLSNDAKRKRGMDNVGPNRENLNPMGMGNGSVNKSSLSGLKQCNFEQVKVSGTSKPNVSNVDILYLLMEKARVEIRKQLSEWSTVIVAKSAVKGVERVIEKIKEKERVNGTVNGGHDQNKSSESVNGHNLDNGPVEPMSIDVPHPDFHDFDRDRTERCFEENQVWAAYDNDDGMPRYYARIHEVISLNPFKIRVSWLNSKTNTELGSLNWVGFGFSKTCGEFRIGKHEVNNSLNSFSHKVICTKATHGALQIFPRKGDVWALYRNWSAEWNELTADDVIHKYEIVEVLEDYDEELGVIVVPLIKVAAFKTVFHLHMDPKEIRRILREEMFRFSHHIPSYLLTGQEAPNAPKGCRELDPAATPFEFLQAVTGVKEAEIMENENKVDEEKIVDFEEVEDQERREF